MHRPLRARRRPAFLGALTGLLLAGLLPVPSALAQVTAVQALTQTGAPPRLSPPIGAWLKAAGIAPEQVGMVLMPLDEEAGGAELNAVRPFNPASTMKLLTSYAALSLLGPEYRWRTGAWLRGPLRGEVLEGDLILRGGGDPKLVVEDLSEFAARMRRAGLRELRGDLIIDESLFDVGEESVERFDGELSQPYNVRPHPLLLNFKSSRLWFQPQAGRVELQLDPPLADLQLDNEVRLIPGPCRHGAQGLTIREEPAAPGGARVRIIGNYSAGCGGQSLMASLLSHREFIHGFFKAVWQSAGGVFAGATRSERFAAQGRPWLEWVSPRTLAEVVRDINKFSNNVMSRNLLLQLAAERPPQGRSLPVNPEDSRRTITGWLQSQGLSFPELVIENGSGLSRQERMSAASLASLLRHAAASVHGDALRLSLPVVGVDGTMRNRLVGEAVAGRAWIKTGSLNEVRSIAGYLDAASGRRYVVVLLINGPRAELAGPIQDQLLRWLHVHG